jgi:hypothetical protein
MANPNTITALHCDPESSHKDDIHKYTRMGRISKLSCKNLKIELLTAAGSSTVFVPSVSMVWTTISSRIMD